MIIPYNPASKAKPPKVDKQKANYFEQEEVNQILQAAGVEKFSALRGIT